MAHHHQLPPSPTTPSAAPPTGRMKISSKILDVESDGLPFSRTKNNIDIQDYWPPYGIYGSVAGFLSVNKIALNTKCSQKNTINMIIKVQLLE